MREGVQKTARKYEETACEKTGGIWHKMSYPGKILLMTCLWFFTLLYAKFLTRSGDVLKIVLHKSMTEMNDNFSHKNSVTLAL